jgi:7-keto-8-aminopelargonate synthetase-like enzyme
MLASSDPVWQAAADHGLIGINAAPGPDNDLVVRETGHRFINMCSCSYLGLNSHPNVIQGAIDGVREAGTTALSLSPTRIRPAMAASLEEELGELWRTDILLGLSCTALTTGILPLLASGHLTQEHEPRVMVFDRFCHFNMAYVKPICADESLVLTAPHNDLDYLEDVCRKYPRVAYVADGAYSMGGVLPLEGLLELQDRYGLFLYLDDSHSLSATGEHGEGYVRSRIELNPLTMVVATLNKAFGTGGGVAMLGRPELLPLLQRHAGPVGWSQDANNSVIGASLASAALHRTPELGRLQQRLRENIEYFDSQVPTPYAGNGLTIRVIRVGDAERAVQMSAELFRRGFYSSAVFFPIVPKGQAGLRIMLRADLTREQIDSFIGHLAEVTAEL